MQPSQVSHINLKNKIKRLLKKDKTRHKLKENIFKTHA